MKQLIICIKNDNFSFCLKKMLLTCICFITGHREPTRVTWWGVKFKTWAHFLILTLVRSLVIKVHFKDIECCRVCTRSLGPYKWICCFLQNERSTQNLSGDWTSDCNVLTPGDLTNRIYGDMGFWETHWKNKQNKGTNKKNRIYWYVAGLMALLAFDSWSCRAQEIVLFSYH